MAKIAKTIKIIFVRPNNIGLLLEGRNLNNYNTLHKRALAKYRQKHGMIESVSGGKVTVLFEPINAKDIPAEEATQKVDKIIIFKDDGAILLLEGNAFTNYQTNHFTGLKYLKESGELSDIKEVKGQSVKITSIQKGA